MDVRTAVGFGVERDEVVLPVTGDVRREDGRATEVVLTLGGLVYLCLQHEAARRWVEKIHAHARVRILVQRGELLRAAGPRETSGREAHTREIDLLRRRVVDALRAAERERRSVRVEIVYAHVEALVLVRDEYRVAVVRRELSGHDVASPTPEVVFVDPPLLGWHECRSGGFEHQERRAIFARVVQRDEIVLAVERHVRDGELRAREIKGARAARQPGRVGERFAIRVRFAEGDLQALVPDWVLQQRDLRFARSAEGATRGNARSEDAHRAHVGERAWRRTRRGAGRRGSDCRGGLGAARWKDRGTCRERDDRQGEQPYGRATGGPLPRHAAVYAHVPCHLLQMDNKRRRSVPRARIELATHGSSDHCSTN